MIVTTGGRGFNVSSASLACSVWVVAYSSSLTAWKPNAEAISSIMSKSSRWLIVTIWPSSLKAKVTICVGGTLSVLASSETVTNSVTRTRVFSRFLPFSRRRSSGGGAPGAADATGRGGTVLLPLGPPPDGAPRATGRGRTGVGMKGRGGGAAGGELKAGGEAAPEGGAGANVRFATGRSEEHTSELQSP